MVPDGHDPVRVSQSAPFGADVPCTSKCAVDGILVVVPAADAPLLPAPSTHPFNQLYVPVDVAHQTVEELAQLKRVQFKDVSSFNPE